MIRSGRPSCFPCFLARASPALTRSAIVNDCLSDQCGLPPMLPCRPLKGGGSREGLWRRPVSLVHELAAQHGPAELPASTFSQVNGVAVLTPFKLVVPLQGVSEISLSADTEVPGLRRDSPRPRLVGCQPRPRLTRGVHRGRRVPAASDRGPEPFPRPFRSLHGADARLPLVQQDQVARHRST